LLKHIKAMVAKQCKSDSVEQNQTRFSRKDVRHYTGWTDFQVRTHLGRLVELEYVLTHRGGRGQSFVYELLYNGDVDDSEPFLSGLIDVESLLNHDYDKKNEGLKGKSEEALSTHRVANKPPVSNAENHAKPEPAVVYTDESLKPVKNTAPLINGNGDRNRTSLVAQ